MENLKAAFAEAEQLLEGIDMEALENMVDQEALKAAVDEVTAMLTTQVRASHKPRCRPCSAFHVQEYPRKASLLGISFPP